MLYFIILIITIFSSLLMPAVISASIYDRLIIRAKRENEIFDDDFLPGHTMQLSVPAHAQSLHFTCGPTVALSLLQSIGFRRPSTDIEGEISGNLCIDGLIINMRTEPYDPIYGGTKILNFVNTINHHIIVGNLNNFRTYRAIQLSPSVLSSFAPQHVRRINYGQDRRLARYVYNSLVNRAPVVLAFTGGYTADEPRRNHFILISGITITEDGAHFSYMDPDGGVRGSFQDHQLNHLLVNGGYLIFHSPSPSGPVRNCPRTAAVPIGTAVGAILGAIF